MLDSQSSVGGLLSRTNCFSRYQEAGLRLYLEDLSVADLLRYETAQELANYIEKEAREQYLLRLAEQGKSKKSPSVDEFLHSTDAPIRLCEMGDVAYKLLRYVHRMFDPISGTTTGVELA